MVQWDGTLDEPAEYDFSSMIFEPSRTLPCWLREGKPMEPTTMKPTADRRRGRLRDNRCTVALYFHHGQSMKNFSKTNIPQP
jgi:hypothetical protein